MDGGVKEENTFACCMKLDAICHSSWAACSVRALGLTGLFLPPPPSTPKATPFSPNQHSSNGLGNCLAVHGLSGACVCVGSVCTQ